MPLTYSTDRNLPCIDPATLAPGAIVLVIGTVPVPVKTALEAMGLVVTESKNADGLLGTAAATAIKAIVYNQRTIVTTDLVRAVERGWGLIPVANVTPSAPTYL